MSRPLPEEAAADLKARRKVARTTTLPALVFAAGMAFLAGATDAYGFVELRGLYVSFMSGNTTMLGMALGGGGLARSAATGRRGDLSWLLQAPMWGKPVYKLRRGRNGAADRWRAALAFARDWIAAHNLRGMVSV